MTEVKYNKYANLTVLEFIVDEDEVMFFKDALFELAGKVFTYTKKSLWEVNVKVNRFSYIVTLSKPGVFFELGVLFQKLKKR